VPLASGPAPPCMGLVSETSVPDAEIPPFSWLIRHFAYPQLPDAVRNSGAYRPGPDGYIKDRDEILQTAIEGVTDQ
jgi:hypothetical protein